jgi:GAF domain-containing protein
MSPETSSRAVCGCLSIRVFPWMIRREMHSGVHAAPSWARAAGLAVICERVTGMDGQLLSETFVELTDTMITDFDVIDFLHVLTGRSAELLDVAAAGLLLADPRGELRVVAASSEAARLLELFQLQADQGPCLDCFRTGHPVTSPDLTADQRWPRFTAAAAAAGFTAVQALPMRLRDQVIGALNLFRAAPGAFDPASVRIGQALADVATIGLLHERTMRRSDTLNEQLQAALNSRVLIEQAKGKLAERLSTDMNQAFTILRDYARSRNLRLSDVARDFINGTHTIPEPPTTTQRQHRPSTTPPRPTPPRPAP